MPPLCQLAIVTLSVSALSSAADLVPIARRLPPAGTQLKVEQSKPLLEKLKELSKRASQLGGHRWQADAVVYLKAVQFALLHDEFYKKSDLELAARLLARADERLGQLEKDKAPWLRERGPIVRGYRSQVDGSVQPYGLVVPKELDINQPVPLFVWLHGRGDKVTDMHFISQRESNPGQIQPPNAIVLHPFGRQCVGWKSAGEIDVLEAIEHVASHYPIDRDRIVLMGFSMGGAGAWHIGAHYADRWVAVSPGAGFAETALYNRLQAEAYPPKYEQALWGVYDVPNYVRNLFNIPVVAYSGELDKQIQAARVMEAAYEKEGQKLPHIIGPQMGHKYAPQSLAEIMQRMQSAVKEGRPQSPRKVTLQTRTLRYPRMYWVEMRRLQAHWQDARVDASVADDGTIRLETSNVARLRLHDWEDRPGTKILIDGQSTSVPARPPSTPPQVLTFDGKAWKWDRMRSAATSSNEQANVKRPGLQGPIDDAFLEPFLVVTPSGKSENPAIQSWIDFELDHFRVRWRALFRGNFREKRDVDVTEADLRHYHVIAWGDTSSNKLLQRLVGQLPLKWDKQGLHVNGVKYDAVHHVPALIYPNPLAPHRYVVVNSGPTFRESHDRTNSLQNPKLPDWVVIDIRQPPSGELPGKIVATDFFDESWQYKSRVTHP